METKRRIAVVAATLAVALGAGHMMQNGVPFMGKPKQAEAPRPTAITPVAATLVPGADPAPVTPEDAAPETATALAPETEATIAPTAEAAVQPAEMAPADTVLAALDPGTDVSGRPELAAPLADQTADCPVTLDVFAAPGATLDVALLAPCHAGERIVLRHGGLAVTGKASVAGSLAASLPGLDKDGSVSVIFADGTRIDAAAALTDLGSFRRFGVQWQGNDAFAVNAFEGGAEFGAPGHIWSDNLFQSAPGAAMGGFLLVLGDPAVENPMLAEVYTFPTDAALSVDMTVEAAVTASTCDREMLGELLLSEGGTATATDLTMAMPGCDAVGDVLVLNNPVEDLKLAASN